MRPRDSLTADERRELDALDRTLAGEPVEIDLRELEALVRDVRATAPEMTPAFAARLEHEVAEGFPTRRERPPLAGRVRRPAGRRLLLPAGGALAAALAALVVALGGGDGGSTTQLARDGGAGATTAESGASAAVAPRASTAAPDRDAATVDRAVPNASTATTQRDAATTDSPARSAAPTAQTTAPSAGTGALAPQTRARSVERSATLALEVPDETFARTTDAVNGIVARFGGIVASAQIGAGDEIGSEATFDLRFPTARLDRALAALAKLGHVTARTQSLTDITGSFSSAQDRLADGRAERRGLLRALARATTQLQIDSLRAQLRAVNGRIGQLQGELGALRRRADLSSVDLTIRGGAKETGATGGGAWTPKDAARDAVRVLEVLAGVGLVALAIAVPLGLLGIAVALGMRTGRRRRRESALDAA